MGHLWCHRIAAEIKEVAELTYDLGFACLCAGRWLQGLMEARIRKIQAMLRDPEIVEAPAEADAVGPWMLVTVHPLDFEDEDDETYLLAEHAESAMRKLACDLPVDAAGRQGGDARLVPARADADDVMQEVCVVLWEKFGTFHEGADFRAPLGRAIIGGVITSTILTLVVIPTMYEILDDWRLKLKGMFKIPERPKTEEYMIPRELRESAPKPSH